MVVTRVAATVSIEVLDSDRCHAMVKEITGRKKRNRRASKSKAAKAARAAKERTSKPQPKPKPKKAEKGGWKAGKAGKAGKANRQRQRAQRKDVQGTLPGLDIWRMCWGWKILMWSLAMANFYW